MTYVYYNLHKSCWSLMEKGKVVGHAKELWVADCEFRVRAGGRKRVLEQKRKNVHAFVIGNVVCNGKEYTEELKDIGGYRLRQVKYNPYKAGYFTDAETGHRIDSATQVMMKSDRTVWVVDNL